MKRTTCLSVLALTLLGQSALAQTTIKINGYAGQDPAIVGDLINRFVKPALAKDKITVTYEPLQGDYNQQLTTQLASGTAGDVFYLPAETLDTYVATGKILPLNGLVNTSPFIKSLNTTFTRNGRLYGIAKDFNTLTLVYNKDLFDEAKVAYPDNNDTWTTLQTKLTNVKKALGNDYYGICLAPDYARMGQFAFSAGWKPFGAGGKTNLLDPAFQSAFNFFTGLAKDKVGVQPSEISQDWSGGCLKTGKVAVAIEGNWIVGFLKDNAPNLKYGTALMPKNPTTGKRGNFLYTVGWAINAGTKNKAAALKVLNLLTSPQVQQYVLEQGLAIPSRTALSNNAYFKKTDPGAQNSAAVFQGASDGTVNGYTFGPKGPDWGKPINAALAAVLSGQQSAADALKKAQADMNALQSR
ncbi:multiple sugar transport system substrate-binding protein [Deinococcus metalli]|uniref:ABC transporter substrate-binding protein n=1 Tax=Deinococcus metalli TaxID=1141878 RepID=A0A7W8KGQ3_9DEIO|nr:ABC transporter substrate-binding protein [Deinococcus metalli]MBB5376696.1 multiple sugar transport system substrate-binding protein [Deinococcus metalli]GHF65821.1 ABC transporter substrate-binding protein [Deinococcus metalli]